jgi:hypothetical protein
MTVRAATCLALWLLLGARSAAALEANQPLPPGPEGEILRVEERRAQALVDADVPALQELLGEELRYTHSSGAVETKYVFIASIESGRLDYISARTRDEVVHVYGETGVVAGTAVLQVRAAGGAVQKLRNLFTSVYVKREGSWRLVAYQSTRAPEGG